MKIQAGIHPHEANKFTEEEWNALVTLANEKEVVAIGEAGLDYSGINADIFFQIDLVKKIISFSRNVSRSSLDISSFNPFLY